MVYLDVKLESSTLTSDDVDVCDVFVKVNQFPYLFALDLYAAVDLNSVKVTINRRDKLILISMVKVAPDVAWTNVELTLPDGGDAAAFSFMLAERRAASIAARVRHVEDVRTRTLTVRREREKYAVNAQMDVERQHREALEKAQVDEKRDAQVSAQRVTAANFGATSADYI